MDTVSIVMPFYNAEGYLEESIRSVLAQRYPHWELILVDDGSTDAGGHVAEAFAQQSPDRIRVIHQKNAGQGHARNTGVDLATGNYLLFVDSDDTLSPFLLDKTVTLAHQTDAEITAFEYNLCREDGRLLRSVVSPFPFPECGHIGRDRQLLLLQGVPWNKLLSLPFYRRVGLHFPERVWYEDFILCTKLLPHARTIAYTDEALYNYRLSNNSIMRNTNVHRNKEILSAMEDIITYFHQQGWFCRYQDELEYLTIDNVYIAASLRLIRLDPANPLIDEFRDYLQQRFPRYRRNIYLPFMSPTYRLTYRLLECRQKRLLSCLTTLKDRLRS